MSRLLPQLVLAFATSFATASAQTDWYVDGNSAPGGMGSVTSVPTPTGFVSMQVGETWGFQYWHRDVAPDSSSSSNFSTACRTQFTN